MKLWGLIVVTLVVAGCQGGGGTSSHDAKFELQGFSISHEEKKESYGRDLSSRTSTYRGRGNLVLVSPSPPDGRHYEVWLRFKATCGKETGDVVQYVLVLNGIGDVTTFCGGYSSTLNQETLPERPPTYDWGSVVAYRELTSAPLTLRK